MALTKVTYSMIEGSTFNVQDYGAVGNGVTDDTAAIQAAAAAIQAAGGGTLYFPAGTYSVFGSTTGNLCSFTGLSGIACIGYGATIAVPAAKTITASEGIFFRFDSCTNILVDGFATNGPVLDVSSSTVKGYEFVRCVNGCKNISMPHNKVKNSLAGFITSKDVGDANTMRSQNIWIGVLDVENCWYGINGQYSGDFMQVDLLRTNTIHRSFFVFGASNLKAKILSRNHKAIDVPVTTLSGLAVVGVDIEYWSTEDSTSCGDAPKVVIGFSNETASTLRDVRVNLNVGYAGSGNTGGAALVITKLNNSSNPDPVDRGHILDNLRVSGTITGTASYNNGGAIVTDTGATWGTGDFFRNIAFENLRITGANNQSQINVTFGNVQDNILFKNVASNYDIVVKNSATDFRLPYVATTEFVNVKCPNLTALNGSAQPLTILRGVSAPDTVQTGWTGKTIGNLGIGGSAVWDLPAAVPGLSYRFVRNDAQVFDIDPNGTELIRGGTAGQLLRMNTAGNQVVLACYIAGIWEVESSQGSYTFV
jgi:hypothetical protein